MGEIGWKLYDLKVKGHKPPHQDRYFIAGVDRSHAHWTPEHRYTYDVAHQIWLWKNAWEDQRKWWELWEKPEGP